jgi:hypothetical protein
MALMCWAVSDSYCGKMARVDMGTQRLVFAEYKDTVILMSFSMLSLAFTWKPG